MALLRSMTCPACGAAISWRRSLGRGVFICPACRTTSRISGAYTTALTVVSVAVAGLLAYALGGTPTMILWSAIIGAFPLHVLLGIVTQQIIAPTLVPTGEFRATLYGGDEEAAAVAARADDDAIRADEPVAVHRIRRLVSGMFRVAFNVLIVAVFVGLLGAASGAFRLDRWLFDAVPALSTNTGPAAFPITVRIREDGLDFTNPSNGPWSCTVQIGLKRFTAAPFELASGQTRGIAYSVFRDGTASLPAEVAYDSARQQTSVECRDTAGFSHYAVF